MSSPTLPWEELDVDPDDQESGVKYVGHLQMKWQSDRTLCTTHPVTVHKTREFR